MSFNGSPLLISPFSLKKIPGILLKEPLLIIAFLISLITSSPSP